MAQHLNIQIKTSDFADDLRSTGKNFYVQKALQKFGPKLNDPNSGYILKKTTDVLKLDLVTQNGTMLTTSTCGLYCSGMFLLLLKITAYLN